MGRDFKLQYRSVSCERGDIRKEDMVERASDCSVALRKCRPDDGWGVPEHRCQLEESPVGQELKE